MKNIFLVVFFGILISCNQPLQTQTNGQDVTATKATSEVSDKEAILAVMNAQEIAWSKNDLEGFMEGYWKSDSLKFYGKSGLTKGWQQTLDNYKKGYPTAEHSGTLNFKVNDISPINENSYWVMGEYFLKRSVGDANGIFMIIFKRIDGDWKIVADMSCG